MERYVLCSFHLLRGETVKLDPEAATTYRKVVGWEHPRASGGTNAVAGREALNEFACYECVSKLRRGLDPAQGSLL